MHTDGHGYSAGRGYRLRLVTLLGLAPLLALTVALGSWVLSLRQQVASLEQRVATLELNQPLIGMLDVSEVGVPNDVDRAMQMNNLSVVR